MGDKMIETPELPIQLKLTRMILAGTAALLASEFVKNTFNKVVEARRNAS